MAMDRRCGNGYGSRTNGRLGVVVLVFLPHSASCRIWEGLSAFENESITIKGLLSIQGNLCLGTAALSS